MESSPVSQTSGNFPNARPTDSASKGSAPDKFDPTTDHMPLAIDPSVVLNHIIKLLCATFSASEDDFRAPGSFLAPLCKPDTNALVSRFALEDQLAVYGQKIGKDGNQSPVISDDEDGNALADSFYYTLSSELAFSSGCVASVAFIRRPTPLSPTIPVAFQILVTNLPGWSPPSDLQPDISSGATGSSISPFEGLHSVLHWALSPYFDAATKQDISKSRRTGKGDSDIHNGIPATKKRLAELELSLLQLQQNIEIPTILFQLHPEIQAALDTAAENHVEPTIDLIPASKLEDSNFLRSVQTVANGWIKSMQNLAKTTRDPSVGTAMQEINFWLNLESVLQDTRRQLDTDGVRLTMKLLRQSNRFHATFGFDSDTGIREVTETAQKYNTLMRDFPLDLLLSADSLSGVTDALNSIFAHSSAKYKGSNYPVSRALPLFEGVSRNLHSKVRELVNGRTVMYVDYAEFKSLMAGCRVVWSVWDDGMKKLISTMRELTRARTDKLLILKFETHHKDIQERINYISTFRQNHDQLLRTITTVLGTSTREGQGAGSGGLIDGMGDADAVEEINQAYRAIKDVDVLDVSPNGTEVWVKAEENYNNRTSRVEYSIIAQLRDRLATARNANEMFRVFSKFRELLVRPKIRGAISEYQSQLLENVKADILSLRERFLAQYGHSEAQAMGHLRDIPPFSGAAIWARQIDRQLDIYMEKVKAVLGPEWNLHAEGQRLQEETDLFRRKLETKPLFDTWVKAVVSRNLSISGRLFSISRNRSAGNSFEMSVNFDAQVITLFKEVRNFLWLNFQVPHAISSVSREAKRVYPFAISLMETVRAYTQTMRLLSTDLDLAKVSVLLVGYQNDTQTLIAKGMPLKWESLVHSYDIHTRPVLSMPGGVGGNSAAPGESKHVQFIRDFAASVGVLQSKVATLASIQSTVRQALRQLETCSYRASALSEQIAVIQNAVDTLNLENYVNLASWVAATNERIGEILFSRLKTAISEWGAAFSAEDSPFSKRQTLGADSIGKNVDSGTSVKVLPAIEPLVHEICIRNQAIYLDPPLEHARASWLQQLQTWLTIVCGLPKIKSSRYDMRLIAEDADMANDVPETFSHLAGLCSQPLREVYGAIDLRIETVASYVDQWLRFQSLWDLQPEQVHDAVGDELVDWLQLLHEIRKSRSTFDTTGNSISFGKHLTIEYEQVQVKVNAKYDQWQHDIVLAFASRLAGKMNERHADIQRARQELEGHSLDAGSTAQAVGFITAVQQTGKKVRAWKDEIALFRRGQAALARQRFQFPSDWLHVEQVETEYSTLADMLDRRAKIVLDQTDALKVKMLAEDRAVAQKIADVAAEWKDQKPVSGAIAPDVASAKLHSFSTRLTALRGEAELIEKAKEALELHEPAGVSSIDTGSSRAAIEVLTGLLEEVQDFSAVWSALATVWAQLNELRERLWSGVQPRKLRGELNALMSLTKEMPSRMRQYAAFEHVQGVVRDLLAVNGLLGSLRGEAVRERHWVKIFKGLAPQKRYSAVSLTLGDVWDLKLGPSEKVLQTILAQAQGEMALEEFLRQVRETWTEYNLELVSYQSRCRLIRGWDDLFSKCSEHLASLHGMRNSPYYKVFEDEAANWEEKLNRVHALFDVWIDVQRQWVYLEGVFTGNADIKQLLPMESGRFNNINTEFLDLMKRVSRNPLVLDVLAFPGVQDKLERLASLLGKIQKALGEYLERERTAFPRFYFVGDEDLLEIIGNGNNTSRVGKHLGKMFAGLAGLVTDEEVPGSGGAIISGFSSRDGEVVKLRKEIVLASIPRVNDWLAALENGMRSTLADELADAIIAFEELVGKVGDDVNTTADQLEEYMSAFPTQIAVLATQVCWTTATEQALTDGGADRLRRLLSRQIGLLSGLAAIVLRDLPILTRKTAENLITEFVHQRDTIDGLIAARADSPGHYRWQSQMRYVYRQAEPKPTKRLVVQMANASLPYGFEYIGVPDRLVRTPLTDRCFLTLTQALSQRLGGSPYGPAGTGKTESVKALGLQLGRFTLVFCCDDTFDFQAMGRIFLGLCRVGAWGCFDEFNRLDERILSAVSQQIQNIQLGLRRAQADPNSTIELVGRTLAVEAQTGIFITMNPGYAGRSNLPDNLKKLFRSVAMTKPDKELIAEVMLYSQGFAGAKTLARQIVPFFDRCNGRLTSQAHYDFGLRALKSVLVSSGGLKRRISDSKEQTGTDDGANVIAEARIIVQSLRQTIGPKLVRADVDTMGEIERETFPGVDYVPVPLAELETAIKAVAAEKCYATEPAWVDKVVQLYQIQALHHGVMLVGSSGSGKSAGWRTLLEALQRVEHVDGVAHVIDPKVMSKDDLYGALDPTTREWTDGLFTSTLRKIVDNLRGEDSKRHWIVFDGDVDPEWVENLNSVLDDNRLLTLPNGERLNLPPNVRILFEVETLRYATPATVSRCGMVWFSDEVVTVSMMAGRYLDRLRSSVLDEVENDAVPAAELAAKSVEVQQQVGRVFERMLLRDNLLEKVLERATSLVHIMEFTDIRALTTLFALVNTICRAVLDEIVRQPDVVDPEAIDRFISKQLVSALVWSLTGDCSLDDRATFGDYLAAVVPGVDMPTGPIIDFEATLPRGEWDLWERRVGRIDVGQDAVEQGDVVIPTVDTVRHEAMLYAWLAEHRPLILCGPPGSGKTMTLLSALRRLPALDVAGINFSSTTSADLVIKTLEQYCDYGKSVQAGTVLAPRQPGRWVVVFCDEINLPAPDGYGTQRAIALLRQLVEQAGFWRVGAGGIHSWVRLERIQFVGACNPPTDPGRTPLAPRFLRHAPVVLVDYPGDPSLRQIYGTLNAAVLRAQPGLRGFVEGLTGAMVSVYSESRRRFTRQMQPQYVYSPRELTRWVRGVFEAVKSADDGAGVRLGIDQLVQIWAHEGLRLFQDRLVFGDERDWTADCVRRSANTHFPGVEFDGQPVLFSNWLSRAYGPVGRDQLREFVKARLGTFCDEEVEVQLVLFDGVLEQALRLDRVFRQPQGHAVLVGVSGSGKTTLARFVGWMNGLRVAQPRGTGKSRAGAYSAADLDADLKRVLRQTGCDGDKVCFLLDESDMADAGFAERMNTLLANGEVPGLFEGEELVALATACRDSASRQGVLLDGEEELWRWFRAQVVRNLHVVVTVRAGAGGGLSPGSPATSPALLNRCVLNWFGDWNDDEIAVVGRELIGGGDLGLGGDSNDAPGDRVVAGMVDIHRGVVDSTPRHFLGLAGMFARLHHSNRTRLEDQQRHLHLGLDRLRETVEKVAVLRSSLAVTSDQLIAKTAESNEKLVAMVDYQRAAEQRQIASKQLQAALSAHDAELATRKEKVLADLALAEPAVAEAKQSVRNIKRQHLTEVRAMQRPPGGVRLALEAVTTLLGHDRSVTSDWKAIQGVVRSDDFIASIVGFDSDTGLTPALRARVQAEFLDNPDFTVKRVNQASKACGPLVQWVRAQVEYGAVLDRVGPLRAEVAELEAKAKQTRDDAAAVEAELAGLEETLARSKEEYAELSVAKQALSSEMATVEKRVHRSVGLLGSLSAERERWEATSAAFASEIGAVAGDGLLAAAFVAYAGDRDQPGRRELLARWKDRLDRVGIPYSDKPVVDLLCSADDRVRWAENGLPADDDLWAENAAILQLTASSTGNDKVKGPPRYPLAIDPSGRLVDFLGREHAAKGHTLAVTSFLDASYIKQLETALRFGGPIVIGDAEHADPVIGPVLNGEYRRTGGRVLVQLGSIDVDVSPTFTLYLATRDPSPSLGPDLTSRTTVVNFCVTRAGLHARALAAVLKAEQPELDELRTGLLRQRADFGVRLRQVEQALLEALAASRGNILDDDLLVNTLETLKKEAADVEAKATDADNVLARLGQTTKRYRPVAKACADVFGLLDRLGRVGHLYRFELAEVVDVFEEVVGVGRGVTGGTSNAATNGVSDDDVTRLDSIIRRFFATVFSRVRVSLLHRDRITLALLLANVAPFGVVDRSLFDILASAGAPSEIGGPSSHASPLTARDIGVDLSTVPDQRGAVVSKLAGLGPFRDRVGLVSDADWDRFVSADRPELCVPDALVQDDPSKPSSTTSPDEHLRALIVILFGRVDRFVIAAETVVASVFGPDFFNPPGAADEQATLAGLVARAEPCTPIVLGATPGFDPSFRVDALCALSSSPSCVSIAMGSVESVASADAAIAQAAVAGTWVLVKNGHLQPDWLAGLAKRLADDAFRARLARRFRVFLCLDASDKIPVSLVRIGRVVMCERPEGLRANMLDSLAENSASSSPSTTGSTAATSASGWQPAEGARMRFLLGWINAVVQERLRYVPRLGWRAKWEFNDSDFECCAHIIDAHLTALAAGRSNVNPASIPWQMLRLLVGEMYAGKVDDDSDATELRRIVDQVLVPDAFEEGWEIVPASSPDDVDSPDGADAGAVVPALTIPSSPSWSAFLDWIAHLPEREPPSWLGLPPHAEKILIGGLGGKVVADWANVDRDWDDGGADDGEPELEEVNATTTTPTSEPTPVSSTNSPVEE